MNAHVSSPRERGTELSPQQRAAWDQGRGGEAPRGRAFVRIEATCSNDRLRAALESVVSEHDILRTHFSRDARFTYPVQSAAESPAVVWRELDLRGLEPSARRERLRLAAARGTPAAEAPPLEVMLARSEETTRVALLTLPALCCDALTLRLLIAAWNAALSGAVVTVASDEPPLCYADFAAWQNELGTEAQVATRASELLTLPFEGSGSVRGVPGHLERALPRALGAQLTALARCHESSLAALCQAVFRAQLARLYDRGSFAFALESSGRSFDDVRTLLGPVARFRPVSCQAGAELHAAQLRDAEQTLIQAEEDDAPLSDAVAAGLVQHIGFAFRDLTAGPHGPLRLEELEIDPVGPRHSLAVHAHEDGLRVTLAFDSARLGDLGARTLLDQFAGALEDLAAGGALPRKLAFDSADATLRGARGHACDRAPSALLHQRFQRMAAEHPARMAVVAGSETLSYAELERRANQLATRLVGLGVAREEPVGLWAERRASSVVGLLAILKAGAAYVPLDPEAPPERLREQVRAACLRWLVGDSAQPLRDADVRIVPCEDASRDAAPSSGPCVAPALDALASLVFTSGSTGVPKAVAITQRAIASYADAALELLALPGPCHFGVVSTLSADLGNTCVFGALASGGTLHVIDYALATDGRAFADYCARWPLDVLKIVPSHLAALLDAGRARDILPRVALVLGGEAFPPALRARLEALAPSCRLINHYGPTETTVGACALPLERLEDARGCATIPIGGPLANAQAYVLDEQLRPAPRGAVGELYLGGAGLARGYHGRPALTAERFVPHPFGRGERLYRTGDRARQRPDLSIEFMGRRDHQLKIRGFRVELGEIEARLREHPDVSGAAVLARPGAAGTLTLSAYLVPRATGVEEASLHDHLRACLPDYMVPQELVVLASMPLTPNGKVDRAALAALGAGQQRAYRPPETEVERVLARLWSELLGVPRVGLDDDFFALGGHSLLAIPLVHRIREALDVGLSLGGLFERPTIAGLTEKIAASPPSGVTLLHVSGPKPPLFCVDPTGFHATAYLGLARALDDRSSFALELADVIDAEAPVALEAIARRLAQRVRRQQASGPYHLLGWSLGGVLAVATARVLEAEGETVALLAIIDTHPRCELYARGEPDAFDELAAYLDAEGVAALQRTAESARAELRRAVEGVTGGARVRHAVGWAQRAGVLAADVRPELFLTRYALLRAGADFMCALQPAALASDILVCWSAQTRERLADAATRWQLYTRGRLREHVVEGDHEAALQSPETHAHLVRALRGVVA